jgi:hypothetical protein
MANQEISGPVLGSTLAETVDSEQEQISEDEWIPTQPVPDEIHVKGNPLKRRISEVRSSLEERKRLQNELRSFPGVLEGKEDLVFQALNEYRIYLVNLSFKAHKVDSEIWELYAHSQAVATQVRRGTKMHMVSINVQYSFAPALAGLERCDCHP